MGRHRRLYQDRPRNVEISRKSSKTYFFYVFPDGRRGTLGSAPLEAFDKANALNAYFASKHLDLAQLIKPKAPRSTTADPLIPDLVEAFSAQLTGKRYSERTRQEIGYRLRLYARTWATRNVSGITTLDLATFLDTLTPAAYAKHRKQLGDLFQFATHRGYIPTNPVTATLRPTSVPKRRRRHTLDSVRQMIDKAPPWLSRSIRLGIYTLQRREDLANLTRDQVNIEERTITVLQRKSRNYRNPVFIEIETGEDLHQVIRECLEDPLPGPHLIRTKPRRLTAKNREAKPHHLAVTPGYLTRSFSELRDQLGVYDQYPKEERPTFHELRALGIHLYTQAGYSKDYVMALSGHSTDAMFDAYERDHETKKPRRVRAGLGSVFPENSRKIPGRPDDST